MSEDQRSRYIDYLADSVTNPDLDNRTMGACPGGFLDVSATDARQDFFFEE